MTAELAFWSACALVLYAYLGYPALIATLGWLRPAPAVHKEEALPAVSLVMVVHDEEAALGGKLENALALDYPADRLDVLVVSDGSRDGTEAVARAFAPRGVRLLSLPGPRGKASALNEAVPQATGEVVVLTDARQVLSADAVRQLAAYFADPGVGAVSGELLLDAPAGAPTAGLGLYWRYEKAIRRAESRFDSVVGATGALYAIRRRLWRPIDPRLVLDDVAIPMEVVLAGYRVLFAPEARAADRLSHSAAREYRRKVRTLAGNYQLVALRPALLNPLRNRLLWQLVSHKLTRLAAPWCLVLALGASASLAAEGRSGYAGLLAAQVAFYALAGVGALAARGGRALRLASAPYAFALANVAAAHALFGFLRGTVSPAWKAAP